MIALIQTLFDKGVAYRSDDGSVYFSIDKFPDYGNSRTWTAPAAGRRAGGRRRVREGERR